MNKKQLKTVIMLIFVSMGGWLNGADTGTIGGLTNMPDFQQRFADVYDPLTGTYSFSPVLNGLIVGFVNIGAFLGCILSSPLAEKYGRKVSIQVWSIVYLLGIVIQMAAVTSWVHVTVARVITGLGIGALSVLVPSYQSETSPAKLRGIIVTTYQFFLTLGILIGYLVVYATHDIAGSASWRIPIAINLAWGIFLFSGMLFLPESPRHLIKIGDYETCRRVMADVNGVSIDDPILDKEFNEMKKEIDIEYKGEPAKWSEIFGPTIRYRTLLGMAIMSFQQLSGCNYFFYYGNNIFQQIKITDSYVASIILGLVNFICTFISLYVMQKFGRRLPLIISSVWMFVCFIIFATVGSTKLILPDGSADRTSGIIMIVFVCLYIFGFATTWAPGAFVIVGETYPIKLRSKCSAVATSSAWIWNFCISFLTPFITKQIGFKYGYVFAVCCLIGGAIVFFFAKETKNLTLEEISELYARTDIKPWRSAGFKSDRIRLPSNDPELIDDHYY